jgi:hypothetical protein
MFLPTDLEMTSMTYQNDPNRRDSSRFGYGRRADGTVNWMPIALALVVIAALVLVFMPSRDKIGPRTTETAPSVNKPITPATPPANNSPPAPSPGPAK